MRSTKLVCKRGTSIFSINKVSGMGGGGIFVLDSFSCHAACWYFLSPCHQKIKFSSPRTILQYVCSWQPHFPCLHPVNGNPFIQKMKNHDTSWEYLEKTTKNIQKPWKTICNLAICVQLTTIIASLTFGEWQTINSLFKTSFLSLQVKRYKIALVFQVPP